MLCRNLSKRKWNGIRKKQGLKINPPEGLVALILEMDYVILKLLIRAIVIDGVNEHMNKQIIMNYRLKKEAVPFFKEGLATSILPIERWRELHVDDNALEKVEDCRIIYGAKAKSGNALSGWSQDEGSHFCFTIVFPSVKYCEHDKFSNGRVIRKLMDAIQGNINSFYNEFNNEQNNE
jgi:hypothetical protein